MYTYLYAYIHIYTHIYIHSYIDIGMLPQQVCAFTEGLLEPMHAEFERTPKKGDKSIKSTDSLSSINTASTASSKSSYWDEESSCDDFSGERKPLLNDNENNLIKKIKTKSKIHR
jgi:hypothetical protein